MTRIKIAILALVLFLLVCVAGVCLDRSGGLIAAFSKVGLEIFAAIIEIAIGILLVVWPLRAHLHIKKQPNAAMLARATHLQLAVFGFLSQLIGILVLAAGLTSLTALHSPFVIR